VLDSIIENGIRWGTDFCNLPTWKNIVSRRDAVRRARVRLQVCGASVDTICMGVEFISVQEWSPSFPFIVEFRLRDAGAYQE
jgi:hypothetical protein